MIKIAVCDDEIIFLSHFCELITEICTSMNLAVKICNYSRSDTLLHDHEISNFDIVFLDIDMPGISGFDTAQKIRNISLDTPIIFVTSREDLVYSSFEYQPFYFIRKNQKEKLYSSMEHVINKLFQHFSKFKTVSITNAETGVTVIPARQVIYIKSEKHYLYYYLSKGLINPLKERNSVSAISKTFDTYGIIQTHQRYLVNLCHIAKLDTLLNLITLTCGDIIPISKQYREYVIEKYIHYNRR